MNTYRKYWVFLLPFLFWSCQEEQPNKPLALIAPPIPELDIAYTTYEIDAATGGDITYDATGSTLKIPPNAFVDTAGQPVTGKVEVLYREFHDAVEILLSGIPMNYDSATSKGALTTAGMFEVKAKQGNQDLAMASGKNIPVRMASFQQGNEYNFYTLNEESRKWEFKGKPTLEENLVKIERLKKAKKMKPSKVFPYDPKTTFIFSYYNLLDIYYNNNWSDIRAGVKNRDLEKKLAGYGVKIYDTDITEDEVSYGKTRYAPNYIVWETTGKKIPKWARSENAVATVKRVRGNVYRFSAKTREGKAFATDVRMVMPIKHLLRFSANYWKNNYEAALAQAIEEERQAQLLAETFRSFDVATLGIHNCDYFTRSEGFVTLNATFDFGMKKKEGLEVDAIDRIYFVSGDGRTIVNFDRNSWRVLTIAPSEGGRFFTVLPTKQLSIFSAEKYASLPFSEWQQLSTEEIVHQFNFDPHATVIEDAATIYKVLGISPEDPKKQELIQ